MKAVICTAYGPPEVLEVREVEKPTPAENEILVKVQVAVVGPADVAFRKGEPFLVKLMYGLRKPRQPIMGTEFAGEVEAVGSAVTQYAAGDRVFGLSTEFGSHAEYMCLKETQPMAKMPDGMSFEDAVAIADGAPTGLTFLRDVAKVQSGQKVLVNGASGAVGAYSVQLAKHYGAHVTGVCSERNVELVQSLGADAVIDYTQNDFTQTGPYDVILDAVGKSSFGRCKGALSPTGVYMTTTVPNLPMIAAMISTSFGSGKKAKFTTAGLKQSTENFAYLAGLFEQGTLKPVIDRRFALDDIIEAYKYVETGRKRGNALIMVAQ